jgi:hypothetical protein
VSRREWAWLKVSALALAMDLLRLPDIRREQTQTETTEKQNTRGEIFS